MSKGQEPAAVTPLDAGEGVYAPGWMPWHHRKTPAEIVDEAIARLRDDLAPLRAALSAPVTRKDEALRIEVRKAAERLSVEGQLKADGDIEDSLRAKMGNIACDLFRALSTDIEHSPSGGEGGSQ